MLRSNLVFLSRARLQLWCMFLFPKKMTWLPVALLKPASHECLRWGENLFPSGNRGGCRKQNEKRNWVRQRESTDRSTANKGVKMSKKEYLYLQQEQKGHKIVQNWDYILLFEDINKIYQEVTNL